MTRGRPDLVVVRRHLAELRRAVGNLQRYSDASATRLRTDSDLRWMVERGLQLCTQNAIDVATHLSSSAGLDAPDYATAIDRLVELGALPVDFASVFRNVAGFRNVLVHGYLEVDLDVIAHVLGERLIEFETFARHVEVWLEDKTK